MGVRNRAGGGLGSASPHPKDGAILLVGLFRMHGANMSPSQGLPTHPLKARDSSCSLASEGVGTMSPFPFTTSSNL